MAPRLKLDDAVKYAEEKGGKFLSKSFLTAKDTYRWECEEGHEFENSFHNIRHNGVWCKKCNLADRFNRNQFMDLITENGGKFLEGTLLNRFSRAMIMCSAGHKWETSVVNIKSGKWCPYCAGNKVEISKILDKILRENTAQILSPPPKRKHDQSAHCLLFRVRKISRPAVNISSS